MSPSPKRFVTPTAVWGLLCLATIVTTWVLSKDAFDAHLATILTFVIVSWKIRLVFRRFMELDQVDLLKRLVFEVWTIAVPLGIGIALAVLA